MPFGEQAWDHARQLLARRGQDPPTETEIAQTAHALLDKAGHGPEHAKPSKKDQKVAGRTRAMSVAERPCPTQQSPSVLPSGDDGEDDEDTGQLADVIPLGIFDAREEARKWW